MIIDCKELGQTVWFMYENKPKEGFIIESIIKITRTGKVEIQHLIGGAIKNPIMIPVEDTFNTKEALIGSL